MAVTVAANAPASVTNTAIISGGGDTNPSNNSASDVTPTNGNAPSLTILKTHVGDFTRGGTGTYILTTTNVGTGPSVGAVTVGDPLATGISAFDITGEGWTCVLDLLTCTRTDILAPGAAFPPVYVKVNVAANAPASIVNTASVRGGGSAPGTSGSGLPTSSDTVRLAAFDPGIRITKIVDLAFADPGQVLTYRVDVTNANPGKVFAATVNDQLPPGFQYVNGSARAVFFGAPSQPIDPGSIPGILTFKVGDLPPGGLVVITYRILVTGRAPNGDAVNTARVGAFGPNGNPLISVVGGARVSVNAALLTSRQFIIGRVYEDLNENGVMDKDERPVAGVRVYLSNGQSASTDAHGMYNIPSVNPGSVVISIDPATIPGGFSLYDGRRYEGQSWSRLLRTPLGGGAMLRQNFGLVRLPTTAKGYVAPVAPVVPVIEIASAFPKRAEDPSANPLPVMVLSSPAPRLKVDISPAQPSAPADGRTGVNVHIRITNAQGSLVPQEEIRIKTSLGQFVGTDRVWPMGPSIDALNRARRELGLTTGQVPSEKQSSDPAPPALFGIGTSGQNLESQFGLTTEQVPERLQVATVRLTNGEANVTIVAPNTSGTALLEAETGDPEHRSAGTAEIFFEPERRSAILVGLGEISVGRAAPEFGLYGQDGDVSRRADIFMRAPWGETLFTAAYTSHLPINNTGPNRGMFQLDPLDRVYPVFGDTSTQFRAAQANTRVYARAERHHSYALFGDLRGDMAEQNKFGVSDYNRNITGLQFHLEDGKKNFVTLQGARPNTAFARDVFPASTLGLTQLSHIALIPGSEMVTLEVRDRYNPELVISREPLLRSSDYNLDWSSGSLFFLRSISAFDQSLNLVQLVVTYEYRSIGGESSVYGMKAQKIFEAAGLTFGFSLNNQRTDAVDAYYLGGIDMTKNLPRHGKLHVEVPVSHGSALAAGFSGSVGTPTPTDVDGFGIRAELDQPLPHEGRIQASFSKTDTSFYNPFGATTLPGSQTGRASVELAPSGRSRVKLGFSDERNKSGLIDNSRETVNLEWKQALDEAVGITFGYAYRNLDDSGNHSSNQANELTAVLDVRLNARTSFAVRRDQNLTTSDPTYPNQTIINARYKVSDSVRLFATQRYSSAPIVPIGDYSRSGFAAAAGKRDISIGVEDRWNKYASLQGRYLVENGLNGTDSFAVIGLVNRIPVSEHFSMDVGMERGTLITGKDHSFTSGSFGVSWLPYKSFRSSARYEVRDRGGFGQVFTAGAAGRVHDGMTALASFQHSDADFQPVPGINNIYNARQSNVTQGNAAFAVRPLRHDSTAVMFSYTIRAADLTAPGSTRPDHDRVSILSTDGYWQPKRPIEFYGKFAMSDRFYEFQGSAPINTRNYLWQGRAQVKLIRRLDGAIEGRVYDQPYAKITQSSAGAELGLWVLRDFRAALGYNFKSADLINVNFLTGNVHKGVYFVLSTKLSSLFNLFSAPEQK